MPKRKLKETAKKFVKSKRFKEEAFKVLKKVAPKIKKVAKGVAATVKGYIGAAIVMYLSWHPSAIAATLVEGSSS